MILRTPRLTLRPLQAADAAGLFAILGDSEAMAHWDRPALPRLATVEAQLADELAAMAAGGFACWTVLHAGEAIGSIDLLDAPDGTWIGFLFRRDMWGRGLAREAVGAVTGHAFAAPGRAALLAGVQSANLRAVRLLAALGFQDDGELAAAARADGMRPRRRYRLARSRPRNGT